MIVNRNYCHGSSYFSFLRNSVNRTEHCGNVKTVKTENFDIRFKFNKSESSVTAEVADRLGNVKVVPSLNLPKELASINNESLMCKYIDASHFKVSQLSDGEYKIYSSVSGFGGVRGSRNDRAQRENFNYYAQAEVRRNGLEGYDVNPQQSRSISNKASDAFVKGGAGGLGAFFALRIVPFVMSICTIF